MAAHPTRAFYDGMAEDYHLIYPDWAASVRRQGAALDGIVRGALGDGEHSVLDCSCGIGTQALGLALHGHRVVGADLSPLAAGRAAREAAERGLALPTAAADMRALPFAAEHFDAVVSGDNSLAHLLTDADLSAALTGMRRVLRPGGLLVLTMRAYEKERAERRPATVPQVTGTPAGRVVTFQLWHWHADGERYDLEHVQMLPDGDSWRVNTRRATLRALTRAQFAEQVVRSGFTDVSWREPEAVGFFQPVLTARGPAR
jgi:SAM-dependent methyltransferase